MTRRENNGSDARQMPPAAVPWPSPESVGSSPGHDNPRPSILELLLGWQESGDDVTLETLIHVIMPTIEKIAAATLRRHSIRDPAAIDEAVSLVLDHLRRLPRKVNLDGGVSRVRHTSPDANRPAAAEAADRGTAFIVWLAQRRACDVARSRRRRSNRTHVWPSLEKADAFLLQAGVTHRQRAYDDHAAMTDLHERLPEAIEGLEHREKLVVELLLDGKSQAVIAHVLDVCEGTVSRLRASAIKSLRHMLAE